MISSSLKTGFLMKLDLWPILEGFVFSGYSLLSIGTYLLMIYVKTLIVFLYRNEGKVVCDECAPGRYADQVGLKKCILCHAGRYNKCILVNDSSLINAFALFAK